MKEDKTATSPCDTRHPLRSVVAGDHEGWRGTSPRTCAMSVTGQGNSMTHDDKQEAGQTPARFNGTAP